MGWKGRGWELSGIPISDSRLVVETDGLLYDKVCTIGATVFSVVYSALREKQDTDMAISRLCQDPNPATRPITPGVCGWSMVRDAREIVERESADSVGEDGPDEV